MAQIPDKTLQAALAEVEAELAEMAKAEQATALRKSREESKGGTASPSASAPAEGSAGGEGSPAAEGSEGGEAPPTESAPPAEGSEAPPSAPTADPAAGAADPSASAGGMPTLEQIVAEYSKLPPEELKLYYLGIKTALAQTMSAASPTAPGMDPSAGASAGPTAPPPGPPAGGPPAPPMSPMGKSETEKALETKLTKSEQVVAEMQKDLATLSKAIELAIGQPQRKAITGIEYVSRAAPVEQPAKTTTTDPTKLNKSEMNTHLRSLVRSGKLSKSDLDNVSKFSEGGQKELDLVKHLFAAPVTK